MKKLMVIFAGIFFVLVSCKEQSSEIINLAGTWKFQIDSLDQGEREKWFAGSLKDTINLPGSMATNGIGDSVCEKTHWVGNVKNLNWKSDPKYKPFVDNKKYEFPYWLIPNKHYYGAAWYQKEVTIPSSWTGETVKLFLERCHWETKVWINDTYIGMENSLGTAHEYDLSKYLSPGKHTITICVDNRVKDLDVGCDSHSISDHTQSNWNGIIGKIALERFPAVSIEDIQLFPDVIAKEVKVNLTFKNTTEGTQTSKLNIVAERIAADAADAPIRLSKEINVNKGEGEISFRLQLGDNVHLWDEFNPNLYRLKISIESNSSAKQYEEIFGMRDFKVDGTRFAINGRPVFLRGTLECAIFPKTGYPPTDVESWKRIINICKSHGLNHIRFHSWCPPEAAFVAADELGFYYQVECSSWANSTTSIGDGKPIDQWLYRESERMIKDYGNHPSFCLMAHGNEPAGANQRKYLGDFVNFWKGKDTRRVYTSGAGWPSIPESDFHNIYSPRIQRWGEELKSIINSQPPRNDYDWKNLLLDNDRPVVSHEIGQWCVYPNYKEIEKYSGVLKATNFEIFQRSLIGQNLGHLADSFLLASGKLQALCYKAEIEAALRTPGFGGFQLLDLHDFPGQGTALVGVLDAFWDEKGYISPAEYKRFCNITVPLARMKKHIFVNNEPFIAEVEVAHFGEKLLKNITPKWQIKDVSGQVVKKGELAQTNVDWGNIHLGKIECTIETTAAAKYNLEVELNGYVNDWDFWVYPVEKPTISGANELKVVQKLDRSTVEFLKSGGSVLFSPKKGSVNAGFGGEIGIGFSSIFWNTVWTDGQKPHTLGILCNPKHPALADFPTEYHSNWQWWDAMSHSNAIILDKFSNTIHPIVRVIDDWNSNRSLALVFEVSIGKGKLMVSGIDLVDGINNRPEARQLLYSLKKYILSDKFNPTVSIDEKELIGLIK
jgi:hypothetical protein